MFYSTNLFSSVTLYVFVNKKNTGPTSVCRHYVMSKPLQVTQTPLHFYVVFIPLNIVLRSRPWADEESTSATVNARCLCLPQPRSLWSASWWQRGWTGTRGSLWTDSKYWHTARREWHVPESLHTPRQHGLPTVHTHNLTCLHGFHASWKVV